MPTNFVRPTPVALIARVQTDIEGELEGVSARIRRRPEYAYARGVAGVAHGLHGHLAWNAEQILPDQASERILLRQADFWGVDRKPATAATRVITVTGAGGTLPIGREWVRVQDGLSFTVDAEQTAVISRSVAITAGGAFKGSVGNVQPGEKLQLVSPIAGIFSEATVAQGGTDGTDLESLPALLERVLHRIRQPVMGGARGDHETWALQVPGVTRAWEYKGKNGVGNPGLGKVALTFVRDLDADIIPNMDSVAAVQAYLDARSPAEVIVFAPTPVPLATQINLLVPDTLAIRAAVMAALLDMVRTDAVPGGTAFVSRIHEAISIAAGEVSHNLLSPTADVVRGFGEISTYVNPDFS